MQPLSEEEFKRALPDRIKRSVNTELMDRINDVITNPDLYEIYKENLITYTKVLAEGKYKMDSYIYAIKYVTHKMLDCTNILAYSKTFPDKIARFKQEGVSDKDVASYVSAYHKSKLVQAILEQAMIPTWLVNQHMFQAALNVQADLMNNAKSEMVRSNAANSILLHLKRPEAAKIELDITTKEDSSIDALREATMALVAQQRAMLQAGVSTAGQVAQSGLLIQGQATVVNP